MLLLRPAPVKPLSIPYGGIERTRSRGPRVVYSQPRPAFRRTWGQAVTTSSGPTDVRRVTAPYPPPPVDDTSFAGRLEFKGGFPTEQTLQDLYDQLDFQRGCQVFLRHLMAAAIWGFQTGLYARPGHGPADLLMHPRGRERLALTGNSETIYGVAMIDTKPGPVVLDVPPRVLGFLNDQWMRPMGDIGIAGPDHGEGGRYLLVPPGLHGELPTEGFVATIRLRTYRQWLVLRAFMGPGGDPAPAKETLRSTSITPLARDDPRRTDTSTSTVKAAGTRSTRPTSATSRTSPTMVDYEPADAISLDEAAELAQIGIEKGKPFAPDERMRAILDEAAQVGSYMAFAITQRPTRRVTAVRPIASGSRTSTATRPSSTRPAGR